MRNDLFCTENKAGGLILNGSQGGMARILWKYFNAPGNVMFVTVNLVTFAGIVTYNSLISANREKLLEERVLLAHDALDQRKVWDAEHENRIKDFELMRRSTTQDVIDKDIDHIEDEGDASVLPEYKATDILLPKDGKCDNYNSQMARMSLFHMIYAYFLCKQVTSSDTKRCLGSQNQSSKPWEQEVQLLRESPGLVFQLNDTKSNSQSLTNIFYDSWKADFVDVFSDLTKSQQFHFPDWKHYPRNLRSVCKKLYASEMTTIEDFQDFYDSIKPRELKRLLRLWLYDYSHLLRATNGDKKEKFYRELIQDCHNDRRLFAKYSSMLLDPEDPRKKLFFDVQGRVPNASIETVLSVLQEYVSLQEVQGLHQYDAIIRLISMIRRDSVMSCRSSHPRDPPQVRILLPTDDDRLQVQSTITKEDRKECLQLVGRNPQAVKLLTEIASWQKPAT